MPTVLREGPYRFFFYSADYVEPPHVHVEREACEAKVLLDPVRQCKSGGFTAREIKKVERLVEENVEVLLRSWDEFFKHQGARAEGAARDPDGR